MRYYSAEFAAEFGCNLETMPGLSIEEQNFDEYVVFVMNRAFGSGATLREIYGMAAHLIKLTENTGDTIDVAWENESYWKDGYKAYEGDIKDIFGILRNKIWSSV